MRWPTESNGISGFASDYDVQSVVGGVLVTLPPFPWSTPLGLDANDLKLFWAQPENMRHFNDSVVPISGLVEVFENVRLAPRPQAATNATHYLNYKVPPVEPVEHVEVPKHGKLMYMYDHEIHTFQHFLDNGVPHLELMLIATGWNPTDVDVALDRWSTPIADMLKLRGFRGVVRADPGFTVHTAKALALAKVVPIVHPIFHHRFVDVVLSRVNITGKGVNITGKGVVFVSRNYTDETGGERMIRNQEELVAALNESLGPVRVFRGNSKRRIAEAMEDMAGARLVVGAHGGAMYNALWAPRDAKVVEIVPVRRDGRYPGQGDLHGRLPFAHLAFHTVAQMNGQPFYRFYQRSHGLNFHVDVGRFIKWVWRVYQGEAAVCGDRGVGL